MMVFIIVDSSVRVSFINFVVVEGIVASVDFRIVSRDEILKRKIFLVRCPTNDGQRCSDVYVFSLVVGVRK